VEEHHNSSPFHSTYSPSSSLHTTSSSRIVSDIPENDNIGENIVEMDVESTLKYIVPYTTIGLDSPKEVAPIPHV